MMKNLNRIVFLFTVLSILNACSFHHYALEVPPGNTSWEAQKNSVIILLGYVTDKRLTSVSRKGDTEAMSLSIWHSITNEPAVLALHQISGETFQLTGVTYPSDESDSVLERKWYRVELSDLPILKTPEPGIYYYGSLIMNTNKAYFREDGIPMDTIIKIAKTKYPKIFEQLKEIFRPQQTWAIGQKCPLRVHSAAEPSMMHWRLNNK